MANQRSGCHVCEVVAGDRDRIVFEDDQWCAYQVAEVPGWITLATREHVDGPDGLGDAQAATLGATLRALTGALREAAGASRVHVVYLGESARHFHLALLPRRPDQPALLDNAGVVAGVERDADPEAARRLRQRVREAI